MKALLSHVTLAFERSVYAAAASFGTTFVYHGGSYGKALVDTGIGAGIAALLSFANSLAASGSSSSTTNNSTK